ncbi:MAG: hypothetical protein WAU58_07135 [Terriglobales bacterium]
MDNRPTKRRRNIAVSARSARWLRMGALIAGLCVVGISSLKAQMVLSFSVYNQVWASGSTVYGSTTTADNSILAGSACGHDDYDTTSMIVTPDGDQYSSGSGGFSASVSGPITIPGEYTEVGSLHLFCSCAGNLAPGSTTQSCLASRQERRRQCVADQKKPAAVAHAGHGEASLPFEISSVLKVTLPAASRQWRKEN